MLTFMENTSNKVALLLRGPARLPISLHATIATATHDAVQIIFPESKVEPFLLSYTTPSIAQLEECLEYRAILRIKEPALDELLDLDSTLFNPSLPGGGSRVNAFKQYYSMMNWVKLFRQQTFGCTHIFYARTDIAFECLSANKWQSPSKYSTAHVKGFEGAGWTCDYIGSAPVSLFCDAWDFSSEGELIASILSAHKGEDPLDYLLESRKIPTAPAPMRFEGHIIRNEEDYARFWR